MNFSSMINGSANAWRIVGFIMSNQGRATRRWQPPSLSTTNNIGSNRTVWVQPTSVHPTPPHVSEQPSTRHALIPLPANQP